MALGANSQANVANSVALGQGSVASNASNISSATLRGVTRTFAGSTSIGVVSIGADNNNTRQLQNVSAGEISSTSTDAVNGSQLDAAYKAIDDLSINAPVQYSNAGSPTVGNGVSTPTGNVTLVGSGGAVGLHNVAPGALSAGSTDAVNGGQLYTTNQNVSNLDNRVTNISNGTTGIVKQVGGVNGDIKVGSETGGTKVDFTNSSGQTRTLSGVTAGTLSATSTEAVNGSQLFDTNNRVTNVENRVANVDNRVTNIENGTVGIVKQVGGVNGDIKVGSETGGTKVDLTNNSGQTRTLSGVTAGTLSTTSTEAVNGSQLLATNNRVTNIENGTSGIVRQVGGAPGEGTITVGGQTGGTLVDMKNSRGETRTVTGVAPGALTATSTDAVNGSQISKGLTSISNNFGGGSTYDPNTGTVTAPNYTVYNNNGTTSTVNNVGDAIDHINSQGIKYFHANSTKLDSIARGVNSVAVGPASVANGAGSIATGNDALANGDGSIATGNAAQTNGTNAVATGANSRATADNTTATGGNAQATASGASAYGVNATASNTNAVATGADSAASGVNSVATGSSANASNSGSVATGASSVSSGVNSIASGASSKATANSTAAYGVGANASNTNALAMGANSAASGVNSVAAGSGANASNTNALAMGANSTASGVNSVATGPSASASKAGAVATGLNSVASGVNSVATGVLAQATADNATATGVNAKATNTSAAAYGNAAQASGINSLALGTNSLASNSGSIAIGLDSKSTGVNTVAIGTGAVATNSVAVGSAAQAGNAGAAFGDNAVAVTALRGTALGNSALVSANDGVALGSASVADRAGMNGGMERFSRTVVSSIQGAISVGSAGNERQITNVAGGTAPTDAVNVRQLNAVQQGAVNYDLRNDNSVNYNNVTLGNGQAPEGTRISNLAPGVDGRDAANIDQLRATGKEASAGIASAMAMAGLPQAYLPGKSMVSLAASGYRNQYGLALGLSVLSDNGRVVYKLNGSTNSSGKVGVVAGAGFHW